CGQGPQFNPLQDTWEWNGATGQWTYTGYGPTYLQDMGMCYDATPGRQYVLLFGGTNGSGQNTNQTWTYDGAWHQQSPANSPSLRAGSKIVYDSARSVCVMFGGSNGLPLAETWEWNGTNWTNPNPQQSPGGRISFALGY